MTTKDDKVMRTFETGATRDTAEGKLDMEGFTHPMVMKQFAKYMNMNRLQSDGKLRDSDNWQKGISKEAYVKSLRRHHDEVWGEHRGFASDAGIIAALCGIMFNSMGLLHEVLRDQDWVLQDFDGDEPTPEMKERQGATMNLDCEGEPTPITVHGYSGDIFQRLIELHEDFEENYEGDLEDVPELPVCFGCRDVPCPCVDTTECDTNQCHDCDFDDDCVEYAEYAIVSAVDQTPQLWSREDDWDNMQTHAHGPRIAGTFEPPADSARYEHDGCCCCYHQHRVKDWVHEPCGSCTRNKIVDNNVLGASDKYQAEVE